MKTIPIIFSTPMVKAILAGRKTQTRRIIKPQPSLDYDSGYVYWGKHIFDIHDQPLSHDLPLLCPYGQPGDRLYVRETWQKVSYPDGTTARKVVTIYRADDEAGHINKGWKPSIHMPRAAARIILEITDVRVERLQDISEEDAIREGVKQKTFEGFSDKKTSFKYGFLQVWTDIYGNISWNSNPWVWCISFKRIEP